MCVRIAIGVLIDAMGASGGGVQRNGIPMLFQEYMGSVALPKLLWLEVFT